LTSFKLKDMQWNRLLLELSQEVQSYA